MRQPLDGYEELWRALATARKGAWGAAVSARTDERLRELFYGRFPKAVVSNAFVREVLAGAAKSDSAAQFDDKVVKALDKRMQRIDQLRKAYTSGREAESGPVAVVLPDVGPAEVAADPAPLPADDDDAPFGEQAMHYSYYLSGDLLAGVGDGAAAAAPAPAPATPAPASSLRSIQSLPRPETPTSDLLDSADAQELVDWAINLPG